MLLRLLVLIAATAGYAWFSDPSQAPSPGAGPGSAAASGGRP